MADNGTFSWDEAFPGFGVRTRNGKQTWVYQYSVHGRTFRMTLGRSEAKARKLAKVHEGDVLRFREIGGTHPGLARNERKAKAKQKAPTVLTLGTVDGLRPRS